MKEVLAINWAIGDAESKWVQLQEKNYEAIFVIFCFKGINFTMSYKLSLKINMSEIDFDLFVCCADESSRRSAGSVWDEDSIFSVFKL